jgi:hypothetical protein
MNGEREKPISKTPRRYQDLYQQCWAMEPKDRPDLKEVIKTLEGLLLSGCVGRYS